MNPHTLLNRLRQRSHVIEGMRVVFDADVAEVYGVSLGTLRRAVTRNRTHFPADFMIQMDKKKYAFAESGILMLSTLLQSPQAIQANLDIIRELFGFQAN